MIGLGSTTGYAIQALICLARTPGRYVLITEIARCADVPLPYLVKVLARLSRGGLVETKRGFRGGYRLARPPRRITLDEVARVVEGPGWLAECLLGMPACVAGRRCPTASFWARERRRIEAELRRWTVERVSRSVPHGGPGCASGASPVPSARAERLRGASVQGGAVPPARPGSRVGRAGGGRGRRGS